MGGAYNESQAEVNIGFNRQIWGLPDDTKIRFAVGREGDIACAVCPRHPDRFVPSRIFFSVCDLDRIEKYDLRILSRLEKELDKSGDQITLGDLRGVFFPSGRGYILGLDILETDVPQSVLDKWGI